MKAATLLLPMAITALSMATQPAVAQYNNLNVVVYVDANNNCVHDPGEQLVPSVTLDFTYLNTQGQIDTAMRKTTDCNGFAVFYTYNASTLNQNTITALSPWVAGHITSCQSLTNVPLNGTVELAFSGPNNTVVDDLISCAHNGTYYSMADTIPHCYGDPLSFTMNFKHYKPCQTTYSFMYTVKLDGVVVDQYSKTNALVGGLSYYTNYCSFYSSYFAGTNEVYARIGMPYPPNTILTPGLHQIIIEAEPLLGLVSGHTYTFNIRECGNLPATGIQDLEQQYKILLYPVPAKDQLSIRSETVLNQIQVSNLVGDVLIRQQLYAQNYELSLNELPAGVYLLQTTDSKGFGQVHKFIKE